jgi:hypothetical protein
LINCLPFFNQKEEAQLVIEKLQLPIEEHQLPIEELQFPVEELQLPVEELQLSTDVTHDRQKGHEEFVKEFVKRICQKNLSKDFP